MANSKDTKVLIEKKTQVPSLNLTEKASENGWLEYDPFLLGWLIFRGELLVSGSALFLVRPVVQFPSLTLNVRGKWGFWLG